MPPARAPQGEQKSEQKSEPASLPTKPPPYQPGYVVFRAHYWYHQMRRHAAGQTPRPTLGELSMTSGLTRPTCRRHRRRMERELAQMMLEHGVVAQIEQKCSF